MSSFLCKSHKCLKKKCEQYLKKQFNVYNLAIGMTQGSTWCTVVQYNDSYNPFTVAENNFWAKQEFALKKFGLQIDLLRMLHFSGSSCTISGKAQALYI